MSVRFGNSIIADKGGFDWVGTLAQYNEAYEKGQISNEWICFITDDSNPDYLANIDLSNLSEEGEAKLGKGGVLEIGDIGISLYVDESKGKRRRLNGSIMAINDNTRDFVNWLKGVIATTPSLATTEQNWQAEITASVLGQCGKFVIDEENRTIRLPKVVNINGLTDLTQAGVRIDESLPNITAGILEDGAQWQGLGKKESMYGAIQPVDASAGYPSAGNTSSAIADGWTFDASRVSSAYQDNAPVQQEAIQYPYFIQIATGAETEVNIVNDIELNNPFTLFDSKYSDHQIFNASWLRSQGQYNSKAVYVKAYEALQVEQNSEIEVGSTVELPSGTQYTKQGLLVKLSTETYNDYDFVLNTSDETFRLPIKSNLASGKAVVGNGITLGLTNGTLTGGLMTRNDYYGAQVIIENYGRSVGASSLGTSDVSGDKTLGITSDAIKSGIETDTTGLYLYYYVGETVQNANLIDAGRIEEQLNNKVDIDSSWGFPSNRYIDLTLGADGSTYTAPANGWFSIASLGNQVRLWNYKIGNGNGAYTSDVACMTSVAVKKGDNIILQYESCSISSSWAYFRFIYAEGEQ